MTKRTFLIAGGALGCLALLVCIGIAALAGVTYYSANLAVPATVDRIAYVDNDFNIQVVDAQGGHRQSLTTDAANSNTVAYMFPTWSRDSRRIAFVQFTGDQNAHSGALLLEPATGGTPTTVYTSTQQLPFYLYWSPNSQRIGFLAQDDTSTSLVLGSTDGKATNDKVDTGSSVFWDWAPDSRSILMHTGGSKRDSQDAQLALVQEGQKPQQISSQPGDFQAPQFAPNGSKMLYASTSNSDQDALYLADARGGNPRAILNYTGTLAFAWSPDGKKIASLSTPADSDVPVNGAIFISDADGKNRQPLIKENALGFYWSPDSKQLAYLTIETGGPSGSCAPLCPASPSQVLAQRMHGARAGLALAAPQRQSANLRLQWHIVSVADGKSHMVVSFTPTDHFVALVPFFDQYARSLTFWSPDSQHLVYTQVESDGSGSVWVADVAGGTQPRRIGDGTLAVWSWK